MKSWACVIVVLVAFSVGCKDEKKQEKGSEELEMTHEHCRGEALRNCQHRHPDWASNPAITSQYSACLVEIYTPCVKEQE